MKKLKLKKPVLYGLYASMCVLVLGALYVADFSQDRLKDTNAKKDDYKYVNKTFDEDIPVVSTETKIMRPYTDDNVKIVQNFYNYKGTEEEQENSIINYDQTYIQNSGVAYGGINDTFDVISSLSGTVISVKEDNLLGNIVEIKSNDKVTTIYQGLTDVNLKENDKINQGDVIGKAGETNINKDLGKHVVFELKINDKYVNPEDYYDKDINEL